MKNCTSGFWPFFVPANQAVRVDISGVDTPGRLKLDVVSGGPAFAWFGRVEAADAQRKVTQKESLEFDLACSANGDAEISVERGPSTITVWAVVDTVAYLQFDAHERPLPPRPTE